MLRHLQPHRHSCPVPRPRFEADPRELVEDYLDHALVELVGVVPYARRQELRRELTDHLQSLADAYEELGATPAEAMARALDQFGPPREIGLQWADAWQPEPARGTLLRPALRTLAGVAPLALASWYAGLFQPEMILRLPLLQYALPLVMVAAFAAGFRPATFRAAGACLALASVTAVSGMLSLLVRHEAGQEALLLTTGLQLLTWLPSGMFAAEAAGWLWDRSQSARRRPRPFLIQS